MAKVSNPKSEDDYKAQYDAEALQRAEEVRGDPKRLKAATSAATKLLKEHDEKRASLERVVKSKLSKAFK